METGEWRQEEEEEVLGGSGANEHSVEKGEEDDMERKDRKGRGGARVLCERDAVGSRAGRPGSAPMRSGG